MVDKFYDRQEWDERRRRSLYPPRNTAEAMANRNLPPRAKWCPPENLDEVMKSVLLDTESFKILEFIKRERVPVSYENKVEPRVWVRRGVTQ
jgi:hypothetical protein